MREGDLPSKAQADATSSGVGRIERQEHVFPPRFRNPWPVVANFDPSASIGVFGDGQDHDGGLYVPDCANGISKKIEEDLAEQLRVGVHFHPGGLNINAKIDPSIGHARSGKSSDFFGPRLNAELAPTDVR